MNKRISPQEQNQSKLAAALEGIELTPEEQRTIEWLSSWSVETVENICNIIIKAKIQRGD